MLLVFFFFAALPAHADCIDEEALARFVWPGEIAPRNAELVIINAPDLSQDGFELLDENNNPLDFGIESIGRGYRRVTMDEPLMPLSLHTLNNRPGDGTTVRVIDFLTEADADLRAPLALETTTPAYRDTSPSRVFGTEGCPPPRPHEYTFAIEGSLDDVVVVELRAEDDSYVAVHSVEGDEGASLFFSVRSPLDGLFYLESVDGAGNRSRSNSVTISGAQECSHVRVSRSGIPASALAMLALVFVFRRRRGARIFAMSL